MKQAIGISTISVINCLVGSLRNFIFGLPCFQCRFGCIQISISSIHSHVLELVIITDSTAADGDFHMATSLREHSLRSCCAIIHLVIVAHLTVTGLVLHIQSVAH